MASHHGLRGDWRCAQHSEPKYICDTYFYEGTSRHFQHWLGCKMTDILVMFGLGMPVHRGEFVTDTLCIILM